MNKVVLMGRLTRDPEIRYSNGETAMAIARFTVAVDRRVKRDSENNADFISCIAFGKTGEVVEKYFRKGQKIALNGRIQTGSYTNNEGQKVYTTDVIAEDIEFVESKNSTSGYDSSSRPDPSQASVDGFMNIPDGVDDEGLPFN